MSNGWALSKNGLENIQSILFGQNGMEEAVSVAISFNGEHNIRNSFQTLRRAQLGIATLDTRDLRLQLEGHQLESIIKTQSFCSDHIENRKHLVDQYRFGAVEAISVYDFATKLRQHLKFFDGDGSQRKLVMIFHQLSKKGRLLECFRISKKNEYTAQPFMTTVDTNEMTSSFFGLPKGKPLSLEAECLELGIKNTELADVQATEQTSHSK